MDRFFRRFGKNKRKEKSSTPASAPAPAVGKQYLEEANLTASIITDKDLTSLVTLPPHIDLHEWLATHTAALFNHVNQLYGTVAVYCTPEACPAMTGPNNVHFHRYDERGRKVKNEPAPLYIDLTLSYVSRVVNDPKIFPTKFGEKFPADFLNTVRTIHRHLFHVLAHLYHRHYGMLVVLTLQGHLNTVFAHLMALRDQFRTLPDREVEVLQDLHQALLRTAHRRALEASLSAERAERQKQEASSDPHQELKSSLSSGCGERSQGSSSDRPQESSLSSGRADRSQESSSDRPQEASLSAHSAQRIQESSYDPHQEQKSFLSYGHGERIQESSSNPHQEQKSVLSYGHGERIQESSSNPHQEQKSVLSYGYGERIQESSSDLRQERESGHPQTEWGRVREGDVGDDGAMGERDSGNVSRESVSSSSQHAEEWLGEREQAEECQETRM